MSRMGRNNPWWAKVIFDEYCAHYFGMSKEEMGNDVVESVQALLKKDGSGNSFGAKMVRLSIERMETNREIGTKNGVKGGRPRKALVPVENQLAFGEFANVMLTQEQFNDLAVRVGNMNEAKSMVESLSCKLEDGSIVSDNHYATLCSWANYRKEKSTSEPRYESMDEHNKRAYQAAMERIGFGTEEN